MQTKINSYLIFGTVFIILTWLFVGVFRDSEFYEPEIFLKYRPTIKIMFHSPIGMQDTQLHELSPDNRTEEIAFRDFVVSHYRIAHIWFVPLLLIQLTLTLVFFGFRKTRQNIIFKKWHLPTHFIINLILTSVLIGFMLSFDNIITSIMVGFSTVLTNYSSIKLLTRQKTET